MIGKRLIARLSRSANHKLQERNAVLYAREIERWLMR